MIPTEVVIDGTSFRLTQGHQFDELKQRIVSARGSAGQFVSFVVVGNREVSVLITSRSQVVLSAENVQFDPRDIGVIGDVFGGHFDL